MNGSTLFWLETEVFSVSENLYWKAIIDIFLIFFSPSIEMNM